MTQPQLRPFTKVRGGCGYSTVVSVPGCSARLLSLCRTEVGVVGPAKLGWPPTVRCFYSPQRHVGTDSNEYLPRLLPAP